MDRKTFDSTMRSFKYRKPFRPFTMAIVDGDRVKVDHSEALVVRDGMAIFAALTEQFTLAQTAIVK